MNTTLDNLKAKETDPFASFEDKGPDCQFYRYVTHHNSFGVNEWIGKTRFEARFTLPPGWRIAEFMEHLIAEKDVEGDVGAGLFSIKTKSTRSKPTPSIVLIPSDTTSRGLVTTFMKSGFWGCPDHSYEPSQKELVKLGSVVKQVACQASRYFLGFDLSPSSIIGDIALFSPDRFTRYFGGSFVVCCPNGTKSVCTCLGRNEKTYRFFLTVCSKDERDIVWTKEFINQVISNLFIGISPPTNEERMKNMGELINQFRASKGLKKLPL